MSRLKLDAPKHPYSVPNPKDALAGDKLPLDLVPESLEVLASLSNFEGAQKYGMHNYRARPVRITVYLAAMKRHMIRLNNGEWNDRKTRVPHISSIICCAGIIGDAWLNGTLIDDRPPFNKGLLEFMDSQVPQMEHLRKLFKGYNPVQYTEAVLQAEMMAAKTATASSRRRKSKRKDRTIRGHKKHK